VFLHTKRDVLASHCSIRLVALFDFVFFFSISLVLLNAICFSFSCIISIFAFFFQFATEIEERKNKIKTNISKTTTTTTTTTTSDNKNKTGCSIVNCNWTAQLALENWIAFPEKNPKKTIFSAFYRRLFFGFYEQPSKSEIILNSVF
jgi:hypothetical protein